MIALNYCSHVLFARSVISRRPQPRMLLRSTGRRCNSIDDYEKVGRICSGSFGSVYRVRHRASGREFALKRMNPSMCHDTNGFSVLYMREVMILKHLSHRRVMRIEEVVEGSEINDFFIVMERCDVDLRSVIHHSGRISMEAVRFFTHQMLEGLVFLHGAGVIHRDLKPSNILLMKGGDLKIADFGLARTVDVQMTNLVVTLWYRPVEVLLGSESYGTSVDMWSVGCIVGEMVAGEPILPGEGEIDQLARIFGLLGYPSDSDLDGVDVPHLCNVRRPEAFEASFEKEFGCYGQDVAGLVRNLLSLDPRRRWSAPQALCSPFVQAGPERGKEEAERLVEACGKG